MASGGGYLAAAQSGFSFLSTLINYQNQNLQLKSQMAGYAGSEAESKLQEEIFNLETAFQLEELDRQQEGLQSAIGFAQESRERFRKGTKAERELREIAQAERELQEVTQKGNLLTERAAISKRARVESAATAQVAARAGSSAYSRAYSQLALTEGANLETQLGALKAAGVLSQRRFEQETKKFNLDVAQQEAQFEQQLGELQRGLASSRSRETLTRETAGTRRELFEEQRKTIREQKRIAAQQRRNINDPFGIKETVNRWTDPSGVHDTIERNLDPRNWG